MSDEIAIEVSGLPEQVSFSVHRGEVLGIIGERPISSSQLQIKGRFALVRNSIPGFSDRLTVFQNLEFWSAFWNLYGKAARQRIGEVLDQAGLDLGSSVRVQEFNPEQRFRLNVARSLLGRPDLLLFEGFSGGLDPWGAGAIRSWVRNDWVLRQRGRAVLISNQVLDMTEICDRVAVFRAGRMIWNGAGKEFSLERIGP